MKLHIETLALVKEERRLTGLVIGHLQKISDTRLFLQMGYSSMFEYCTRGLGYSESCAYRRISAAKLSAVIPEVKSKLNSGEINLTNLSMAQSFFARVEKDLGGSLEVLDLDAKRKVLTQIENCSKKQTEEILSHTAINLGLAESLAPVRSERIKMVSGDEAVLQVKLKKSTIIKLDQIKSLRAHKNPNMSYVDLIEDMCEFMLKKIDPNKAKDGTAKSNSIEGLKVPARVGSRYIPSQIKRAVWRRDQGQCTYQSQLTQQRCLSKHLLQIDHVIPFSKGGPNLVTNLRLLCHAHHQLRDSEAIICGQIR